MTTSMPTTSYMPSDRKSELSGRRSTESKVALVLQSPACLCRSVSARCLTSAMSKLCRGPSASHFAFPEFSYGKQVCTVRKSTATHKRGKQGSIDNPARSNVDGKDRAMNCGAECAQSQPDSLTHHMMYVRPQGRLQMVHEFNATACKQHSTNAPQFLLGFFEIFYQTPC